MARISYGVLLSLLLIAAACRGGEPPHGASTAAAGPARPDTAEARMIADSVELCRTTEAELKARLGPPDRDGLLHGEHVVTWFVQPNSPERFLTVLLDSAGVVVDDYWDVPQETPVLLKNRCAKGAEPR